LLDDQSDICASVLRLCDQYLGSPSIHSNGWDVLATLENNLYFTLSAGTTGREKNVLRLHTYAAYFKRDTVKLITSLNNLVRDSKATSGTGAPKYMGSFGVWANFWYRVLVDKDTTRQTIHAMLRVYDDHGRKLSEYLVKGNP
jgi:hypothetical protein